MEEKLIEHISKEIEILITNTMSFRMKSAFTIWVAPYLLLGTFVLANDGDPSPLSDTGTRALIIAASMYFLLGLGSGLIESAAWRRCDKLRHVILDLTSANDLARKDLPNPLVQRWVLLSYAAVFAIIGISFLAIATAAIDLITTPSSG